MYFLDGQAGPTSRRHLPKTINKGSDGLGFIDRDFIPNLLPVLNNHFSGLFLVLSPKAIATHSHLARLGLLAFKPSSQPSERSLVNALFPAPKSLLLLLSLKPTLFNFDTVNFNKAFF